MRRSAVAVLVLALLLPAGCQESSPDVSQTPDALAANRPLIVIPPGVVSSQTAADVEGKMLAQIASNERLLGRVLAPARIIRIQLLRDGEPYPLRRFDGSNPNGAAVSPSGGPGWVVEAVGTFVGVDPATGQIDALGTHGLHLWDDAGGEGFAFLPCWTRVPTLGDDMEGSCR